MDRKILLETATIRVTPEYLKIENNMVVYGDMFNWSRVGTEPIYLNKLIEHLELIDTNTIKYSNMWMVRKRR